MKEPAKVSIRITSFRSGASPSYHAMRTESNKNGAYAPRLNAAEDGHKPVKMQSEDKDAERKPVHRPYTGFLCT